MDFSSFNGSGNRRPVVFNKIMVVDFVNKSVLQEVICSPLAPLSPEEISRLETACKAVETKVQARILLNELKEEELDENINSNSQTY